MPVIQGIDTEYKPWGGLAGFTTGERRAEMDAANMQELQSSQLGNAIKEVEARRAQADFSNPEMEQWRQQGILGKNKQAYSDGELSYQTLDSNVKTKLAENLSKASAAEIEATINGLDQFTAVASSGNPLAMHQAISSLPPQYQKIVQQLGPEKAVQYAKQLSDTIKQARADSPAHRAKLAETDRTYENQEIIHQGDRESREKISANEIAQRMADRAAAREASKAAKDTADKARVEDQLTRRIAVLNSEFKANETELKRVSEELSMVGSMPLIGMTKQQKEAERTRIKTAKETEKRLLEAEQNRLRQEARRIAELSSFRDKKAPEEKPQGTTPSLPPGVSIVK